MTLWFTGLSGAGKTTLARQVAADIAGRGLRAEVLDGDVIRRHLSAGLSFSREDRDTHVRRIGYVSHLLSKNGVCAIVAAISPYRALRDEVRQVHGETPFVEIFVDCPLEVLVARDVKGLYRKAIRGEIANFTGISDPYEAPENADIVVRTDRQSARESAAVILQWLESAGRVKR